MATRPRRLEDVSIPAGLYIEGEQRGKNRPSQSDLAIR